MAEHTLGLTFRETMSGGFTLGETDPEAGAQKGKAAGTILTMHATIMIHDLRGFLADPEHAGTMTGRVSFAPIGQDLPATGGLFNLFQPANQPESKWMIYEMTLEHAGQPYSLAGKKEVRDDPGFDLWKDTTTLFTQLHRGLDKTGPMVGAGILTLSLTELVRLVSTLRVLHATSLTEQSQALFDFGRFFLGELWETYGTKPS